MTALAVMRADFLERLRAPAFMLVLLAAAFVALLAFPSPSAHYATLNVYGYRGLYTSAWIGDALAVQTAGILPLFGFYLIKNAIALDRRTGVATLLASSGLPRLSYIGGKWLSNMALITVIMLVMNAFAIVKQLYIGESYAIDLYAQFRTQVGISLPIFAVIAGWAVLFESLPVLRGGVGNMLYVFVWAPFLVLQMESGMGVAQIIKSMEAFATKLGPLKKTVALGGSPIDAPLATFDWPGGTLDGAFWLSAVEIAAFGIGLMLLATLFFRHRPFDFALPHRFRRGKAKAEAVPAAAPAPAYKALTPLKAGRRAFAAFTLIAGEVRLMLRSRSRYWYFGLALLYLLSQTMPLGGVREGLLPATALWATLALSSLGCRDRLYGMVPLLASTPHRESGRLLAQWLAGVVLQGIVFAGLMARFALSGDSVQMLTLLVAALFIPALALGLGRLSGTARTFEFVYVFLWYAGPLDHGPALDFLGTTLPAAPPVYDTFLVLAGGLVALALLLGLRDPMAKPFPVRFSRP